MRQARSALAVAFLILFDVDIPGVEAAAPQLDPPILSRTCGVDDTGPLAVAPAADVIEKWIRENRIAAGGVIPVHFHVVVSASGEGNVSDAQLERQISALNNSFSGLGYDGTRSQGVDTGYTFYKASVTRTTNGTWFRMTPGSSAEVDAKLALGVGWTSGLNLYTCRPAQGVLGWGTLPWTSQANTKLDGVVVHYGTLPGGTLQGFNLGGTSTHEVGHWVGLYHTFQGGCSGGDASPGCTMNGDLVCDTPAEAIATAGCPIGKNSCASGGEDPIHNYMDYSSDACYDHFTAGQSARMHWAMSTYRKAVGSISPSLPVGRPATPAGGPELVASPNPFNPTTTLDYAVPHDGHVSLRVYDVAGRAVATLVQGERSAGVHRAVFEGRGLASGIYVATLEVDGQTRTQRLVLLK